MCITSGQESHVIPPAVRYHLERSETGTFFIEGKADIGTIIVRPSFKNTLIFPRTGKDTFLILGTTFQKPSSL